MSILSERFTKRLVLFAAIQLSVILGLIWIIAGNDWLFRNTVPIEQRLVSQNDAIRKKAQQELLGLETDSKKQVVSRLVSSLASENPFVRKWAAISLALVGPAAQEAIPALLQNVSAKEKDVVQAARVALSEIGAPDAQQLPSLLKAVQESRDSVQCEAVLSIGKMGPAAQEAVPVLFGTLRQEADTPSCFEEALASLASGLPAIFSSGTELLSDGHAEIRRKAAHMLALAGARTPETITPLFDALGREADPKTRAYLSKALRLPYVPSPDYLAVLNAALNDDDHTVRLEAAKSIRQSGPRDHRSLPLILKMVRDPDPFIRRLGLETLRRSGLRSAELLRSVARAQRDADPGVRCRASETLIESGSTDRVSIALLINDLRKDEDTARCAEDVLGLAGLFDFDVISSMMKLVQDDSSPDVRSRAARVLMHLGPRAREAIPALLRAQKDQIPGVDMALRAVRAPISRRR